VDLLSLASRWILIVEDKPRTALDMAASLQQAGAKVLSACFFDRALQLADHLGLSPRYLTMGSQPPSASALAQRQIPVVMDSDPDLKEKIPNALTIAEPSGLTDVVDALNAQLRMPFVRRQPRREVGHAAR